MTTTVKLESELANYERQFLEAKTHAQRIENGLTAEQLSWRPAPKRWSIAECFNHLNVTAELYMAAIDTAIQRGRRQGLEGRGPFRHGFLMNFFIRTLEPPSRTRFRAPSRFLPPPDSSIQDAPRTFVALQDALIERVRDANGLHLARIKLTSPVSRMLRMSLGQAFGVVAAHQRRHLLQAARVRDDSRLPE